MDEATRRELYEGWNKYRTEWRRWAQTLLDCPNCERRPKGVCCKHVIEILLDPGLNRAEKIRLGEVGLTIAKRKHQAEPKGASHGR